MKTQIVLLALIVGVLAAGSAYAATDDTRGDAQRNRVEQADTDGNGRIDKQEFAKAHEIRFEKMDANRDGAVTRAALEAAFRDIRKASGDAQAVMHRLLIEAMSGLSADQRRALLDAATRGARNDRRRPAREGAPRGD